MFVSRQHMRRSCTNNVNVVKHRATLQKNTRGLRQRLSFTLTLSQYDDDDDDDDDDGKTAHQSKADHTPTGYTDSH